MDDFVCDTLTQWQLTDVIDRFKDEGIDEESFLLLDEGTISQLIPKAGPRLKFLKKCRGLIEPAVPPTSPDVQPTATTPPSMEDQTAPVVPAMIPQTLHIIPQFDIRQILTGSTEGKLILGSLDEDVIIPSQRKCLVRILVSHLMEKFGESPTSETKKALAAALIHGFPSLKDESDSSSGFGYWFTPGRNRRPATGFLEERLRNVRKRMRKPARSQSTQQTPPQSSEASTRRTFIPECTISEERAIQCKEWLKHNSQPLNQVEQYMQDTAVYRAKSLRENGWDIQGIRQEFPHLFTPGMVS
ncbi:uncharacterized protein LOC117547947 [Gymnodraco acuticeps]|uniref:Uncharacterized protein LOC117547947 n=1 Tax=Gymnodraco acuticeps TaxID=8218 RepID=A0A6P8UD84_GYMAC|nr:uncharacterized protein LOC117547947 [Gymnodraco acuticeps]